MNNFLVDVSRVVGVELSDAETKRQLVETIKRLASQGERFQSASGEEQMILFVGKQEDNIVDIKVQVGPNMKQLWVVVIGNSNAFMIEINHMDTEVSQKIDIEAFMRANINPRLRAEIENNYPNRLPKLKFVIPTVPGDLSKLVHILESTTVDTKLLEQTIEHETKSGYYPRKKRVDSGHGLFGLLGRH